MVTSALIYQWLKVGAANFLAAEQVQLTKSDPTCSLLQPEGIEKLVPQRDKCLNALRGYVEK